MSTYFSHGSMENVQTKHQTSSSFRKYGICRECMICCRFSMFTCCHHRGPATTSGLDHSDCQHHKPELLTLHSTLISASDGVSFIGVGILAHTHPEMMLPSTRSVCICNRLLNDHCYNCTKSVLSHATIRFPAFPAFSSAFLLWCST